MRALWVTTFLTTILYVVRAPVWAERRSSPGLVPQGSEPSEATKRLREALTLEEWRSIENEGDAVRRVRRLLEFSSLRLNDARQSVTRTAFSEAARALDAYRSTINGAFYSVDPLTEKNDKKRRSGYKEFDVGTRPHLHLLEGLVRDFVGQNSPAAEDALASLRRLRAMALNRFSGSKIIKVPGSD